MNIIERVKRPVFLFFAKKISAKRTISWDVILGPLAWIYRRLVALRHFLYDHSILGQIALDGYVVSIGNIAVGGVGKTGFLQRLLLDLQIQKAAILSRGYKRTSSNMKKVSSVVDGDEAFLLTQMFPQIPVYVGKKRERIGEMARKNGAQLFFLDDGMQYRRLKKNLEICVLHKDRLCCGDYLPLGFLRDDPQRLRSVDYVVINAITDEGDFRRAEQEIRCYTQAPIIGGAYQISRRIQLQGKKIAAFCGIGMPENFFELLRKAGARIVYSMVLGDHETASKKELRHFFFEAQRKNAEILVCTSKDKVKYPGFAFLEIPVQFQIFFGKDPYQRLIEQIRQSREKSS